MLGKSLGRLAVLGAVFAAVTGCAATPGAPSQEAPMASEAGSSADPMENPPVDEGPQAVPSGEPLPSEFIGRAYTPTEPPEDDSHRLVLRFRPADDPHCTAMFDGDTACFTILWEPNTGGHRNDPGARGAAVMRGEELLLAYRIVPNDIGCEGHEALYSVEEDGATLQTDADPGCGFAELVEFDG